MAPTRVEGGDPGNTRREVLSLSPSPETRPQKSTETIQVHVAAEALVAKSVLDRGRGFHQTVHRRPSTDDAKTLVVRPKEAKSYGSYSGRPVT